MKITKTFSVLIVFILLISACKKDESFPLPDERYPYTYYALNQQEWEQVNSEFKSGNNHDSLFINEFGFLEGKIFLEKDAVIDASLVISETKLLLLNYSKYLGIHNSAEINLSEDLLAPFQYMPYGLINVYDYFKYVFYDIEVAKEYAEYNGYEYVHEPTNHYLRLVQSKIAESKFESAQINFWYFESDNTLEITGNWFPKAFFPSYQIYDEKAALKIASESFSDELDKRLWTNTSDKFQFSLERIMCPQRFSDRIEIHECWKIIARGNKYYTIIIDTQSGEVLSKKSDYYVL